jgi:hypothetical protein
VAERHGEDSPQVARLDRQMAMEHGFLVNSRSEIDRLKTPILERDAGAWQVHGYLRSQDGLPRADYTVGLFPYNDGKQVPLISTETDKRGYFHMLLAVKDDGDAASDKSAHDPDVENDADDEKPKDDAERDQQILRMVRALETTVFLGTIVPGQTGTVIDAQILHPQAGATTYRDITVADPKDDGSICQLRTRLLGNSGSRELHDLDNEKPGCQISEIRPDRRFFFQTEAQAQKLGYDFCAYCFGKEKSKR